MYGKILLMAGAVVLAILFLYDPSQGALFPKCPFLLLTGYKCPGCGSQRALHALLHGEVKASLGFNALLVLSLPYVITGFWLEWLGGKQGFPNFSRRFFGPGAAKIWLAIVLAWWLLRNLSNF